MFKPVILVAAVLSFSALANPAFSAEESQVLTVKGKQFEPKELAIPAGVKVKLLIKNENSVPVEFESHDLSREVIVPGKGETTIYIGPLKPGRYRFFNEFDQKMQGAVVVKAGEKAN